MHSVRFKAGNFVAAKIVLSSRLSDRICLIRDVRMSGLAGPRLRRRATSSSRVPIIFTSARGYEEFEGPALQNEEAAPLLQSMSEATLSLAVKPFPVIYKSEASNNSDRYRAG